MLKNNCYFQSLEKCRKTEKKRKWKKKKAEVALWEWDKTSEQMIKVSGLCLGFSIDSVYADL